MLGAFLMDRKLKVNDKVLQVADITVKVTDRKTRETDRPWNISCFKLYFSVNFENFVEVYVNVNGILLPIRKGGDGFEDDSGGSKGV
jgi:hypothetical protein